MRCASSVAVTPSAQAGAHCLRCRGSAPSRGSRAGGHSLPAPTNRWCAPHGHLGKLRGSRSAPSPRPPPRRVRRCTDTRNASIQNSFLSMSRSLSILRMRPRPNSPCRKVVVRSPSRTGRDCPCRVRADTRPRASAVERRGGGGAGTPGPSCAVRPLTQPLGRGSSANRSMAARMRCWSLRDSCQRSALPDLRMPPAPPGRALIQNSILNQSSLTGSAVIDEIQRTPDLVSYPQRHHRRQFPALPTVAAASWF